VEQLAIAPEVVHLSRIELEARDAKIAELEGQILQLEAAVVTPCHVIKEESGEEMVRVTKEHRNGLTALQEQLNKLGQALTRKRNQDLTCERIVT
jgi:hypothetical protein